MLCVKTRTENTFIGFFGSTVNIKIPIGITYKYHNKIIFRSFLLFAKKIFVKSPKRKLKILCLNKKKITK